MLEDIIKMPKIELHLHFDGSLSLSLAQKISGSTFHEIHSLMVAPSKCENLKEYLNSFTYANTLLQKKENIILFCKELLYYLESQNIIYAEIRFSPMKMLSKILSIDELMITMIANLQSTKVKVNLILCLMRGDSYADNLLIYNTAKKYFEKGVGGIDLAGSEEDYPFSLYSSFFEQAEKDGLFYTIHAGETSKKDLYDVLKLHPTRIGHGIHLIEDDGLLEEFKKRKILLEICPTSNVQTNNCSNYLDHPISKLKEDGVKISVNTDNITVSNISLIGEYIRLYQNHNFQYDDFQKMNLDAIDYAFLPEEEKENLRKIILK